MRTTIHIIRVVLGCFMLILSSLSFAADRSSQMSPEVQKDMADMYKKMADCLRTGQSPEDCQRKVAKDCPVVAKTGQCPIDKGMEHIVGPRGMRPEGMGPVTGPRDMP